MTLSNRRAQRGFSRVDLGMLLIVTFLGVLMSLTVDRWVYGGKHLKALGEWSDVKLAEYQRGTLDLQVMQLLNTNLHSDSDRAFILLGCVAFGTILFLIFLFALYRRVRRYARPPVPVRKHGRRAAALLGQKHRTRRNAA